jgi:hypothetical protein
MKRPFVPLLLFAVLALVAASAAPAQEVERPPTELWDEFPLEATPTPAAATPQATPTPRVVREPASGGMSPPALVALLIAAAGVGALAARTATRRLRPSVRATPPSPTVATADEPVAEAKPAPTADPPAPPAPRNGQPKRRGARPGPGTGTGRPKQRTAKPKPTAGETKRRTAKPKPTAGETKPRTAKPKPTAGETKPRAAKPKPTAGETKRRAAKPGPTAGETKRRAPKPRQPSTSRPEREDAGPPIATPPDRFQPAKPQPTPAPAAAPDPTPAPAAPPRPFVAPSSPAFDACRIRLHNRSIKAHFFAVPYDGGPVLARSPYFKIRRAEDEPGVSAPEALRSLVDDLTAAGWRQTSAGRAPWDLRFERATSAREPAAPRRAR